MDVEDLPLPHSGIEGRDLKRSPNEPNTGGDDAEGL